jgi:hypothetical protein
MVTRPRELSGLALYLQTGVSASFRLGGRVWLEAAAAVGVPLRGLEATDNGEAATGASGLQLSGAGGVSVEL